MARIATAIALLALVGCQDDAAVGPSTQDFSKARKELAAKLKQGKTGKVETARKAEAVLPEAAAGAVTSRSVGYQATGRRDPFRSFEWEQLSLELADAGQRGPLEQFDVAQLAVVGVVWDDANARALIKDPSGMSYIVGEGARIGKNDGRVVRIDDNLVVVRETYVDFNREETTKDIEMQIRATEGG